MKNNRIKTVTRIVALVLAALLAGTVLVSALSLVVNAADDASIDFVRVCRQGSEAEYKGTLITGESYSLIIEYTKKNTGFTSNANFSNITGGNVAAGDSKISIDTGYRFRTDGDSTNTDLKVSVDGNTATFRLHIKKVVYKRDGIGEFVVQIKDIPVDASTKYSEDLRVSSDWYVNNSSGGSSGGIVDDPTSYTSQIVVENAVALDSGGNRIDEVTEDTPSFTLEIVYADMGLQNADVEDLDSGDMQTFLKNGSSFEVFDSARGSVKLTSRAGDYPRFRATFTNVKYTGVGKDVGFAVFYKFDDLDTSVAGEGTATLTAAKAKDGEDDDKKMGIPVPKIIISNYSYGEDTIEAGSEFGLAFSIQNTSADTAVENIVVTLTPASNEAATKGPGLIVASSSNTIYVPVLAAGATQSYNVSFQARPDAEVTSHLITVQFSYEYVDENLKTREKVPDLSESIAIPVSQIDRFVLEPILETVYGQVNEEAYLTVSFINRGKSSVNNIYGTIKVENPAITAPGQAYGHLEAGKPDSLDMYLTSTEPGEFTGEVVIQYEDENNNVKELSTPFTMFVEEPWYPPMEEQFPPDGMGEGMEPPTQGPGLLNIIMCAIGGIAIAVPIALYLMKRVKAKGSEEFDEDF